MKNNRNVGSTLYGYNSPNVFKDARNSHTFGEREHVTKAAEGWKTSWISCRMGPETSDAYKSGYVKKKLVLDKRILWILTK